MTSKERRRGIAHRAEDHGFQLANIDSRRLERQRDAGVIVIAEARCNSNG